MQYKLLKQRGALQEGQSSPAIEESTTSTIDILAAGVIRSGKPVDPRRELRGLAQRRIPQILIELVPGSLAWEHHVIPVESDGETITLAARDANDLALADTLRFTLGVDVRLVKAPADEIDTALRKHYTPPDAIESMCCEFTETAIDFDESFAAADSMMAATSPSASRSHSIASRRPARLRADISDNHVPPPQSLDQPGDLGMFFYVVPEGQRVLARHWDGRFEEIIGPRRGWRGYKVLLPMTRYVAHPGEFLLIRYLDGRQQHVAGPADIWFDSRVHASIAKQESLQLAAKEAVVVYRQESETDDRATTRRIVYGPTLFYPQPGEWLHTFSWHASRGGSQGVEKIPNGLVFQKLWLMPDQMYHDVRDVRTADSAVLTIRLMIFFELAEIERMLDNTHDPIGDFVNAATADVVEFVGKHDFESFKGNTDKLNDVATYRQLLGRAAQSGYRITNVVYRGYGAAQSLQQMHDQAIEARTRLQLDRETEEQAQELEDFKLQSQLSRTGQRRDEQVKEARHTMQLAKEKAVADMEVRGQRSEFEREQQAANARCQEEISKLAHAEEQQHLKVLGEMGVELTRYLTQSRADRVIEFRNAGSVSPQVLIDGQQNGDAG